MSKSQYTDDMFKLSLPYRHRMTGMRVLVPSVSIDGTDKDQTGTCTDVQKPEESNRLVITVSLDNGQTVQTSPNTVRWFLTKFQKPDVSRYYNPGRYTPKEPKESTRKVDTDRYLKNPPKNMVGRKVKIGRRNGIVESVTDEGSIIVHKSDDSRETVQPSDVQWYRKEPTNGKPKPRKVSNAEKKTRAKSKPRLKVDSHESTAPDAVVDKDLPEPAYVADGVIAPDAEPGDMQV